jgi:hypothetical protein
MKFRTVSSTRPRLQHTFAVLLAGHVGYGGDRALCEVPDALRSLHTCKHVHRNLREPEAPGGLGYY